VPFASSFLRPPSRSITLPGPKLGSALPKAQLPPTVHIMASFTAASARPLALPSATRTASRRHAGKKAILARAFSQQQVGAR